MHTRLQQVVSYATESQPLLIPFLLVYLFAGFQTWRLVMLFDPDNSDALSRGIRVGDPFVTVIFFVFAMAWPAFLAVSWISTRLERRRE